MNYPQEHYENTNTKSLASSRQSISTAIMLLCLSFDGMNVLTHILPNPQVYINDVDKSSTVFCVKGKIMIPQISTQNHKKHTS